MLIPCKNTLELVVGSSVLVAIEKSELDKTELDLEPIIAL